MQSSRNLMKKKSIKFSEAIFIKQLGNKFQSHLEGAKKAKYLMPSTFSYLESGKTVKHKASNVISEH